MKAKFGKLSIGCFIANIVLLYLLYAIFRGTIMVIVPFVVSMFTGLILGYLSALRQEEPKYYRYIGFFLNLLFLLFCMITALS